MKFLSVAVLLVAMVAPAQALEPQEVPEHLQKIAVTVKTVRASGSGTILARQIEGKTYAFILTAHHVIDGLRKVTTRIVDGKEFKEVKYDKCKVTQERVIDGATVGEQTLYCRVVATSPRYDIAVLLVLWPDKFSETDTIPFLDDLPRVGSEVFHCGSPSGQVLGHNSLTEGIIAAQGRMFDELPYTQTTVSALPGSSGGMVVNRNDGTYVGMLTLGIRNTDSFNYIVPSRRIIKWAKAIGFEYLVNPEAKALDFDQLADLPIEATLKRSVTKADVNGYELVIGDYVSCEDRAAFLAKEGFSLWIEGEGCVPTPDVK